MIDFAKITVFAPTEPPELHYAIIDLLTRKSGVKVASYHERDNQWLEVDRYIVANATKRVSFREMPLHELCEMPDYAPTKKMTLAEIAKALGHEVEIIK